jgi:Lrp/AsnC family transcriptional regulator, regulator for asnA, asnC and gidA
MASLLVSGRPARRLRRVSSRSNEPNADQLPDGVDELDRAIIAQLQEDGRRAFRAIARSLGVAEGTVRARANRLQRDGVMSITAFAHPEKLGYGVLASLLLRVAPARRAAVVEELVGWPEVMYLSSCTGRADLMAQVVTRDLADVEDVLLSRLSQLDGVLEVDTLVELKVHKAHYQFRDSGSP